MGQHHPSASDADTHAFADAESEPIAISLACGLGFTCDLAVTDLRLLAADAERYAFRSRESIAESADVAHSDFLGQREGVACVKEASKSGNPIDFIWQGIVGKLTRIIRNHP